MWVPPDPPLRALRVLAVVGPTRPAIQGQRVASAAYVMHGGVHPRDAGAPWAVDDPGWSAQIAAAWPCHRAAYRLCPSIHPQLTSGPHRVQHQAVFCHNHSTGSSTPNSQTTNMEYSNIKTTTITGHDWSANFIQHNTLSSQPFSHEVI